ncbi:response regulator transcription factor [Rhodobacteraceae bacterium XHP0102]|nr:response regulator transcription factor [Rhodobacteraceae bacterium XHP0102]
MTTISIIEDNEDLRRLTKLFLEQNGFSVTTYEDAEALLTANEYSDIYVIDINLPEMDGYELTRKIRKIHPWRGIVVLSARDSSADMARGYESGCDIYLAKPTAPEVILGAVRRLEARSKEPYRQKHMPYIKAQTLHNGPSTVQLSEKEATLMQKLILAGRRGLERFEIAEILGMDLDADLSKSIELRILRLRRKLNKVGLESSCIGTVRRYGYRLTIEVCYV